MWVCRMHHSETDHACSKEEPRFRLHPKKPSSVVTALSLALGWDRIKERVKEMERAAGIK